MTERTVGDVRVRGWSGPRTEPEPMVLPPWRLVRQAFDATSIRDVEACVLDVVRVALKARPLRPSSRVAVAVGSRGIVDLPSVVAATVRALRQEGHRPFVVASMGSHGGATPDGQRDVLRALGITEESIDAAVDVDMNVDVLGHLADGTPIHVARSAVQSDAIVPVCRVKPHTAFRGHIESGLCKMLAIGLGKHVGARTLHEHGFERFADVVPEAAAVIISRAPVAFGIAVIENASERVCHVEAIDASAILAREPELLALARERMGRLLVDVVDVLVVDEIGKDISGDGMDPNVTGRFSVPVDGSRPAVQKIVVMGLSERTHGNAMGIGLADVTTERLAASIDVHATYVNAATAGVLAVCKIPMVCIDQRSALETALRTCVRVRPSEARIVRIRNTLDVSEIVMSEPLWREVRADDRLTAMTGPSASWFDGSGRFAFDWGHSDDA